MKRISLAHYMLPGSGRTPPHRSSEKMTPAEAARVRALYPIAGTTEYSYVAETEAERAQAGYPSAGRNGLQPA